MIVERRIDMNYKLPFPTNLILGLVDMTFLVFVTYSLVVTNNDTVFVACGHALWDYMISRLILGYLFFVVWGLLLCVGFVTLKGKDGAIIACFIFLLFAYHVSLVGVGAKITSDAMQITNCTSSLSAVSFTQSPLLAQLGYVYVALDSLWVLLIIMVVCCGGLATLLD
jgi:hypothetical protein